MVMQRDDPTSKASTVARARRIGGELARLASGKLNLPSSLLLMNAAAGASEAMAMVDAAGSADELAAIAEAVISEAIAAAAELLAVAIQFRTAADNVRYDAGG